MRPSTPLLLSLNAGYVDTAGFLALRGLFTAHVTGNFVTLAASAVHGTSGAISKLLALPTFCIVVIATRTLRYGLLRANLPVFKITLGLHFGLLILGGALAIALGPFPDPDRISAIVTGLVLVAAMAIQNAAHRVHLPKHPPSTLMTGTSTQIMLDLADLMHGVPTEERDLIHKRLAGMSLTVATFAAGCALAALLFTCSYTACFVIPPIIALVALFGRWDPT